MSISWPLQIVASIIRKSSVMSKVRSKIQNCCPCNPNQVISNFELRTSTDDLRIVHGITGRLRKTCHEGKAKQTLKYTWRYERKYWQVSPCCIQDLLQEGGEVGEQNNNWLGKGLQDNKKFLMDTDGTVLELKWRREGSLHGCQIRTIKGGAILNFPNDIDPLRSSTIRFLMMMTITANNAHLAQTHEATSTMWLLKTRHHLPIWPRLMKQLQPCDYWRQGTTSPHLAQTHEATSTMWVLKARHHPPHLAQTHEATSTMWLLKARHHLPIWPRLMKQHQPCDYWRQGTISPSGPDSWSNFNHVITEGKAPPPHIWPRLMKQLQPCDYWRQGTTSPHLAQTHEATSTMWLLKARHHLPIWPRLMKQLQPCDYWRQGTTSPHLAQTHEATSTMWLLKARHHLPTSGPDSWSNFNHVITEGKAPPPHLAQTHEATSTMWLLKARHHPPHLAETHEATSTMWLLKARHHPHIWPILMKQLQPCDYWRQGTTSPSGPDSWSNFNHVITEGKAPPPHIWPRLMKQLQPCDYWRQGTISPSGPGSWGNFNHVITEGKAPSPHLAQTHEATSTMWLLKARHHLPISGPDSWSNFNHVITEGKAPPPHLAQTHEATSTMWLLKARHHPPHLAQTHEATSTMWLLKARHHLPHLAQTHEATSNMWLLKARHHPHIWPKLMKQLQPCDYWRQGTISPSGPYSWSNFNHVITEGKAPSPHLAQTHEATSTMWLLKARHHLPIWPRLMKQLQPCDYWRQGTTPTYQSFHKTWENLWRLFLLTRHRERDLREWCVHGETQNPNEGFTNIIWPQYPKTEITSSSPSIQRLK